MMESRSENPDEQKQQLQTAMKAVGLAIQLDTSGSVPDAYLHYLSCMQYISQALLQDARVKVSQAATVNLKTTASMKMVKLAQRCSERVVDILNNMDDAIQQTPTNMPVLPTQQTTTYSPSPPPSLLSSSSSLSSSVPAGRISPSMFPAVPSTLSHTAPTHVAVVRPTVQHPTQQRTAVPNASPSQQSNEALGPLEKAYRENRKLMAAYRSRLNKMHTTSKNKSLVNLTFQRRLMENMAIAKAREASLAKKIKERQQRLQEQAAQRFSSSGQPTKEEMELRTVYANILEYENVKTWLQEWRKRLQESPGDLGLIRDLLTDILSCDQHPLSQLLKRYQIAIYHKIMPLIQKELPSIEEIVVPYRDVQSLKLQEPRAVPEDGFTTPDALDQSMEDTLAQRLHALRENSTSSVESDSTEPRPSSQASSMLFAPSDVSDDIMEELMSDDEEEEEVDALERVSIRDKNIHRQHGGCHQRAAGEKDVGDDDEEGCEENGHLDDSGIQNGEESSSTDEAAPSTDIQDKDVESASNGANVAGDAAPEVDQMREIRDEIRNDIEQALEDGERLCKELEGETVGKVEDDEDGISNAVATTGDSMSDGDRENTGDGRTSAAATDEQHSKYDNREGINGHSCPDTDERTNVESGDERTNNSEGNRPDMQPSNNPPTQLDSSSGGVASDGESTDAGRMDSERESDEGKKKEDGEERIAEMRSQALSRHLKCITKDVLMFTERLQSLLVAVYEQLNSTAAKEQCISVIEDFFFKDIWQPLLMLFRRYNYKKEECAAIAMTMYQHALPQHIGVVEKFCLLNEGAAQDGSQASSSDYPYQAAVEELQKLQGYTCPLQKIECIVRVSRIVIECVGDYYESQGKPRQSPETTVGCDDLLPILSYVIMRSSLPQIVSECNAMEEFIHEGYLFGEEGYCLTTCQTALSYVLKLGSAEERSKS